MAFKYEPPKYALPEMPKLQGTSQPIAPTEIKNSYTKTILDTLGRQIKAPVAYSQNGKIEDLMRPTQELGQQFIQQTLLPDFQENQYNPYRRNTANQLAASNLSLMGNAKNYLQAREKAITQPFMDQVQGVQDQFNQAGAMSANDFLRSYYDPQVNF
jgi:hypothetical protein